MKVNYYTNTMYESYIVLSKRSQMQEACYKWLDQK